MAENDKFEKLGKASKMELNRKAELLNCSKDDGTFVMKFYEDGLAEKAEEYIKKDSPIDEHDVIVCNDIIAVCTNSIGRSTGLADELLNLFNHGNIDKTESNDKFEKLVDAYAKYPQSTLVMRKQYVDELNARIAQLEDDNALLNRNNENLRIDKKEIEKEAIERISEAEKLGCEEYHVRADDVLCEVLEKLGFKALVERYNSESKWYA